MATAADVGQALAVDVVDAFVSIEKSLRRWSSEGPPGNQRGAAATLADNLGAAVSKIQGFASENAWLQKEQAANSEKLADFEKEVSSLKASIAELTIQREVQESIFQQQNAERVSAVQKELREEKDCSQAKIAQLQAREGMWQEDWAAVQQVTTLRTERCELRTQLDQVRLREAVLAAQVASVLPPVSVMCRPRPLESYAPKEIGDGDALVRSALVVDGGEITVEAAGAGPKRKFLVDRVLDGGEHSQEEVFGSVAPWVENVITGGSSCIMAYGATGSGKTYTLLGSNGSCRRPGIAHHALKRIIEGRSRGEVKLTMVEVYCDQVRDLLADMAPADSATGPPTLQCSRRDRGRMAIDSKEVVVSEYSKAEEILNLGFCRRTADATLCNDQSSRSHVVLTVETCGQGGKLVLIDLAGSENIKRSGADEGGKLLAEAKAINKSLSALADVVEAVAKRQSFVPYRNSRLTQLLEETLSVAKICLLVHVSPLVRDGGLTAHSLTFAGRIHKSDFGAQQIKKDQEERSRAAENRLLQENRQLQGQLEQKTQQDLSQQKTQQDLSHQVSRISEQLRASQRDLAREQELRSKLEAANREQKNVVPQRPRSPLSRQERPRSPHPLRQAQPPAPAQPPAQPLAQELLRQAQPPAQGQPSRRFGFAPGARKIHELAPEEAKIKVSLDRPSLADQTNVSGDSASLVDDAMVNMSADRRPLANLTNCIPNTSGEAKVKEPIAMGSLEENLGASATEPKLKQELKRPTALCAISTLPINNPFVGFAEATFPCNVTEVSEKTDDKLDVLARIRETILASPSPAKASEVAKQHEDKAAEVTETPQETEALATPTKTRGDSANVSGELEAHSRTYSFSDGFFNGVTGGDARAASSSPCRSPIIGNGIQVKPALRKVPTDFTERMNRPRAESCPTPGARPDYSRIKFADQLQEASSPPRWYMDWLESDALERAGRGEPPKKIRQISPRRSRNLMPKKLATTESEVSRWR